MPRTAGALLARRALGVACVLAACGATARAELLYFTEFEAPFLPGPDNWQGTEGWVANSNGLGVHGIDDDQLTPPECSGGEPCPPADQTAFLGAAEPDTPLVVVAKPINHPTTPATKTVILDTLMGIQDSSNGNYDSFWISVYNSAGDFLAGLRFNVDFSVIRSHDGVQEFAIPNGAFFLGEHQLFCIEIDFFNNRWRVDVDGIPLFPWIPFTGTSYNRNLGSMSYEWQLNGASLADFGDNWMMVVDCIIWAVPPAEVNFHIDQVQFDPTGQPQIEFTGNPGWTYQVQYTEDLQVWHSDLPGSSFSGLTGTMQLQFTDPTQISGRRWYRVERSVTP